jgi:DNA polymerase III delta subunit
VRGDPFGPDFKAAKLVPCYLFYGVETFQALEFIDRVRELLFAGRPAEFGVERFYIPETGWREVVDSARTTASLFADWRILIVKAEAKRSKAEDEAPEGPASEAGRRSKGGEEALKDYLAAPSDRTVLIIVLAGPVKKTHPIVKLLSPFPETTVVIQELKPLKEYEAKLWLEERAARLGKRIEPEARDRLIEVTGCDPAVLAGEIEKLALFTDERRVIKLDDIELLSGWVKSFEGYEIENVLLAADIKRALVVLDRLFRDGHRGEEIVNQMTRFFRDLLMTKLQLREGKPRREIFVELKPQISFSFRKLYEETSGRLFGLVDRLSFDDLRGLLDGLRRIDERIKTSDSSAQALLERFVVEYGVAAERRGIISPGRLSGARPAG